MAADYFEKSRCRVSLADGLCEQDGPDFGVTDDTDPLSLYAFLEVIVVA